MILHGNDPFQGPSFSLGNRLLRALWGIVYLLFFRFSPFPFYAWRVWLLRLFGAQIGRGCHIHANVKVWAPWNLILGNHVGIGNSSTIYCMDQIRIGDYAVISQGAHLCAGSHDFNTSNMQLVTAPIVIGSRVWLCAETFVGPGVRIAEGTVVGARGVVTKSINDPWLVWAGVPVRQVGVRDKKRALP